MSLCNKTYDILETENCVMSNLNQSPLFDQFATNNLSLSNRIVMAPMTRGQSHGNIPSPEVSKYYRRRAEGGAGLIITECTFVDHPTANGFLNAPAFYGEEALNAWARVVDEVHAAGGKIMPQIWHAGPSRNIGEAPDEDMPSIGPMDSFDGARQVVAGMSHSDIQAVRHTKKERQCTR